MIGRTAALSYPDWWTPSVHHKKGQPSTATSHESRPGKHIFLHLSVSPPWLASDCGRTDNSEIQTWQALGTLSQYQHKMLHNNAAQQRHSEKPASAPKASQTIPQAQGRANILMSTLQQRIQHEDTQTASLTDGNMDTHIIHIQDAHSPPLLLDFTTPAKHQTQQQPYGPAGMLGQNSELSPRFARHHPLGEGYGQTCSVLGPEQGTEQGMLPRHATQGLR